MSARRWSEDARESEGNTERASDVDAEEEEEDGGSSPNAARLLEALEALSNESGMPLPASLRGLLGQLQGNEASVASLFPFLQLLEGASHPRFGQLLQSLGGTATEEAQMSSLSELCEQLSLSSEEALMMAGFNADKFVPPVLALVRSPASTELLLLAARALAMLLDLFPTVTIPVAVEERIVPTICEKLKEIEYMDIAESAFQILDRLVCKSDGLSQAADIRREIIAANGMIALLQYVDFFPLEIQRTAARVVAGLCVNMTSDSVPELQAAMPLIKSSLLESRDAEILQRGCECFYNLSTSSTTSTSPALKTLVANESICLTMIQLLENLTNDDDNEDEHEVGSLLSIGSCSSVIQYLSIVVGYSDATQDHASEDADRAFLVQLRHVSLPPLIAKLLRNDELQQDAQLLSEVLRIAIAILPPPQPQNKQDEALLIFAQDALPAIIHVYETSTRNDIRRDCLGVILRATLVGCHAQPIVESLASFLARILRPAPARAGAPGNRFQTDTTHLHLALQIVRACLQGGNESETEHVESMFQRYGVATAVQYLVNSQAGTDAEPSRVVELSKELIHEYWKDIGSIGIGSELETTLNELEQGFKQPQGDRRQAFLKAFNRLEAQFHNSFGDAALTAHEVAASGMTRLLLRLLSDEEGEQAFLETFLTGGNGVFLDSMISSIHESIAAERDAFRVDLPYTIDPDARPVRKVSITTGSIYADLEQLSQHIKVKVRVENNELEEEESSRSDEQSKAIQDVVILVEPLARIETVEDYIADKLIGSNCKGTPQDSSRRLRVNDENDEKEDTEDDEPDPDDGEVRIERSGRQKCFDVYYQGELQRSETSILGAVLKGGKSNEAGVDLRKLWTGAPHELVFKRCDKLAQEPITEVSTVTTSGVLSERKSSFDGENEWWDNVWDLLAILRNLDKLARSTGRSLPLTSSFLSLQVHRAMNQPVRVVTHTLPRWCFRLVNEFPFVLDIQTRFDFTFATACGPSRAIQYFCRSQWKKAIMEEPIGLQLLRSGSSSSSPSRRRPRDRGSASARTAPLLALSRMVKLPRLKVRVSRSRLLQSAMKLYSIYGGKMAVIEIEFLGEVGTGLGPTTEFYTLICQELQAASLHLWRDEQEASRTKAELAKHTQADVVEDLDGSEDTQGSASGLPIRGYHRVAVYHCSRCKRLQFPRCAVHDQLLTHDKKKRRGNTSNNASDSIPQCAQCLDKCDWHSKWTVCHTCGAKAATANGDTSENVRTALRWWILSDEESQYLHKVYPRNTESLMHPILQCAHCDTVNFPGTDAGIVVVEDDRMMSPSGRRMHERDYRAVTKHVSPLCEGTPLTQLNTLLTRDDVDVLVDCLKKTPDVLDSEVDALSYLNESSTAAEIEAVDAPLGLFPKAYAPKADEAAATTASGDVLSYFNFMGRFLAQAVLDERLLNLPFSRPFLRAIRGETLVDTTSRVGMLRSLDLVEEFDPAIAKSLRYLYNLSQRVPASEVETQQWQAEVDAMCLAFTLVGDATIELEPHGAETPVMFSRLESYVALNVSFLLDRAIAPQLRAFHAGFEAIFGAPAPELLRIFTLDEVEAMLTDKNQQDSMWDRAGRELREHMVCAHGFTRGSRAIADLVSILCELDLDEQRLFVRFVTGANRLPLGGLKSLEPKLTVVRKLAEDDDTGATDAVLPSASTCTNYLKLPEYSTRAIMQARLQYCIHEGQCSFHLS